MKQSLRHLSKFLVLFLIMGSLIATFSISVSSASYSASTICLTPGATESSVNFTWYSTTSTASLVQIGLKSDMVGDVFPASSTSFNATVSAAATGYYTNKVIATGLAASTQYVYRIGDGNGNWTANYFYTTPTSGQFSFIACGDPQIGSSGNITNDINGWADTLSKAITQFPSLNYLITTGDLVETNTNESQYTGFFTPSELTSLPIASALGNHDNGASNYSYHFNLPNLSTYGVTSPGSADYYFLYGNALFMVLNTNNTTQATHSTFVSNTVAANPQVKWRIIVHHQSIYSSGPHSSASDVVSLRSSISAICDANSIDMVIAGHDHHFCRSYQMLGGVPNINQTVDNDGNVVNPTGTVYFTLNSGSGSKYYSLNPTAEAWVASRHQYYVPEFSVISISDTKLSITTYRTDTMAQTDTYGIVKNSGTVTPTPTTTPTFTPSSTTTPTPTSTSAITSTPTTTETPTPTPAPTPAATPGSFTLVSPANAAISVSRTPTFTWNASSGASSYTIVVSMYSNLSSPVINISNITGTSYESTITLSRRTKYYWKVTAVNSTGSTDCNSVFSFTTKR